MTFVHDLEKWKEAEKIFARYLIDYPDLISIEFPRGKFKEWDIRMTYGEWKQATYEIKRDLKTQETWNFIIEYRCSGKPSWIYCSKADYIVYFIAGKWWIQSRAELLLRIQNVEKRETKGWDWFRASLYVIKADKLPDLFEELNLDEKQFN